MKKLIAILISTILIISVVPAVPASAVVQPDVDPSYIYFNAAGWENFNKVYCSFQDFNTIWVTPALCERHSGTTYKLDLNKLKSSRVMSDELVPGKTYGIIFHNDNSDSTYLLTFSTDCIGDTAYLTGKKLEHPSDNDETQWECVWLKNSDKYGPRFAINSSGGVTGRSLFPDENAVTVVGNWIANYYLLSGINHVSALEKAFTVLGIDTEEQVLEILGYVEKKLLEENGYNEDELFRQDSAQIRQTLYNALYKCREKDSHNISTWKVFGKSEVVYNGKSHKPKLYISNGTTTIRSSKNMSVSYKDNVNAGKAIVTINGKGKYHGKIVCWFRIRKADNPLTIRAKKSVTASSKKSTTIKNAVKVTKAQGAISYKTSNSKVKVKNGSLIISKGLKKGKTYTVKITATAKGNNNYKSGSKTVTVKIKVK